MPTVTFDSDRIAEKVQKWMVSANLRALTPRSLEKTFLSHRLFFIRLWQMCAISVSLGVSFLLRFDFIFPRAESQHLLYGLAIAIVVKTLVFYLWNVEH